MDSFQLFAQIFGLHSRSDQVVVKSIEDFFEIGIYSKGKWYIPMSAEGFFPEWSDSTYMITTKEGAIVNIEGVTYKKFIIGEDIKIRHNKLSKGEVFLSDEDNILIISGRLGKKYKWSDSVNHSGEYRNINIEKPKIETINSASILQDYMGSHIKVIGRFSNYGAYFNANGVILDTWGCCSDSKEHQTYELIGILEKPIQYQDNKPVINVIKYRDIE